MSVGTLELAARYGIAAEWMTDRNGRDIIAVPWTDVAVLLRHLEQAEA